MLALATFLSAAASNAEAVWHGPGRFCGYVTIIDLRADEIVAPLSGAVETARYRWTGAFGALEVYENNWAAELRRPGRIISEIEGLRVIRSRRHGREYLLSDNGHLLASVTGSGLTGTASDLPLLRRIRLADRPAEQASDCHYRFGYSL